MSPKPNRIIQAFPSLLSNSDMTDKQERDLLDKLENKLTGDPVKDADLLRRFMSEEGATLTSTIDSISRIQHAQIATTRRIELIQNLSYLNATGRLSELYKKANNQDSK